MKTFIDLFCGIGGFHQALTSEGLDCVFACDIDKTCQEDYEKNYGIKPVGDIINFPLDDIPPHDILCGGFPCQPFSQLGDRRGFADDRGNLIFEILKIAQHCRPKIMLLENVPGLLTLAEGRTFDTILAHIFNAGYYPYYSLLNASDYGVPQARIRIYFVCIRQDLNIQYQELPPTYEKIYLTDILESERPEHAHYVDQEEAFLKPSRNKKQILGVYLVGGKKMNRKSGGNFIKQQRGRIHSGFCHVPTFTSACNHSKGYNFLWFGDDNIRSLTKLEMIRAMGFPDNFIMKDTSDLGRRIANAVIPRMISVVYRGIQF